MLTSTASVQRFNGSCSERPGGATAALLMSRSQRPHSEYTRSASASMPSESRTSSATGMAFAPAFSTSAAVSSIVPSSLPGDAEDERAVHTTSYPLPARSIETRFPIPRLAPVTTATLFDMRKMLQSALLRKLVRTQAPERRRTQLVAAVRDLEVLDLAHHLGTNPARALHGFERGIVDGRLIGLDRLYTLLQVAEEL